MRIMRIARHLTYLPADQYLALERDAETKREYVNGEVFAMVGASRNSHADRVEHRLQAERSR